MKFKIITTLMMISCVMSYSYTIDEFDFQIDDLRNYQEYKDDPNNQYKFNEVAVNTGNGYNLEILDFEFGLCNDGTIDYSKNNDLCSENWGIRDFF